MQTTGRRQAADTPLPRVEDGYDDDTETDCILQDGESKCTCIGLNCSKKGALRRVVGDKDSVQQILGVLLGLNTWSMNWHVYDAIEVIQVLQPSPLCTNSIRGPDTSWPTKEVNIHASTTTHGNCRRVVERSNLLAEMDVS